MCLGYCRTRLDTPVLRAPGLGRVVAKKACVAVALGRQAAAIHTVIDQPLHHRDCALPGKGLVRSLAAYLVRIALYAQRWPSRGTVLLFGRQLPKGRVDILRRIGSMVESPSPYLHLIGRENLEVHTRLLGVTPRVIEETLDIVNLLPMRNRLVRHYSTGLWSDGDR